MNTILQLHSEDAFRILGNKIRIGILRRLETQPATISQLGKILHRHPAQIRYHLKQLEKLGLVNLIYTQRIKNYQEKYYQATTSCVLLNNAIFPWPSEKGQIVILGGDGPAMNLLLARTNAQIGSEVFCAIPAGSLDSLIYLRENYCQIAGCHLFDFESGDFNVSYIRHIFTFKNMALVTFGIREQGLLFPKENPYDINSVQDILQKNLRFINRTLGSATRLRFDKMLSESNISPSSIIGYDTEVQTHVEVGEQIQKGNADVGLGLASIAYQMNLGFQSLFFERYDLVMSKETLLSPYLSILVDQLRCREVRTEIENLGGYDLSHAGDVIDL